MASKQSTTAGETWKPVPGWEGFYEVSDMGRIRSLIRNVGSRHEGGATRRSVILKPSTCDNYGYVTLSKNCVCKRAAVHRTVLEAFVGPCPDGNQACHNNGCHRDNRLDNLRWDTKRANESDKRRHGTIVRGARVPSAKLDERKVAVIKASVISPCELASEYAVSVSTIHRIRSDKCWAHVRPTRAA